MNSLVKYSPELNTEGFAILKEQAQILIDSKLIPFHIKTPEQALTIFLQGRELGLQPIQSISNINIIQGKPTISPQLMLALINSSGLLEDIELKDEGDTCTVMMKRKSRSPHFESFSQEDAKKMQLTDKDNWKKQARTMRKWRAIAACSRFVFPDVILGFYTPDEAGAITDEDGQLITADDLGPIVQEEVEVVQELPKKEQPVVKIQKTDDEDAKKVGMIKRIKEMWLEEAQKYSKDMPEEEKNIQLKNLSYKEIYDLGVKIKARLVSYEVTV